MGAFPVLSAVVRKKKKKGKKRKRKKGKKSSEKDSKWEYSFHFIFHVGKVCCFPVVLPRRRTVNPQTRTLILQNSFSADGLEQIVNLSSNYNYVSREP